MKFSENVLADNFFLVEFRFLFVLALLHMFWAQSPVLVDGILDLASYMADMAHPSCKVKSLRQTLTPSQLRRQQRKRQREAGGKLKDETSPPLEISGTLWSPGGY